MATVHADEATSSPVVARTVLGYPVAAALAVIGVRWWISSDRVVYHMTPDEPGQLAIARFVGGGVRWNMFDHSTWRPAYGTVISPIHWFTDDPSTSFRAALAVNAVLGGVACVLLYLLARRLTDMSALLCAASALALSLAPAVLFTTDWVWAEGLVAVAYLAAMLALLRFHDSPTVGRGVAMVTLVILGFSSHSRLLPLAIVAAGVIVLNAARQRILASRAAGLLAYLLALFLAASWYSEFLVERIWEQPHATNSFGGVFAQLAKVGAVLASAIGQTWYQLVTTVGLAGVGIVALVRSARRRTESSDGVGGPSVADASLVLAAVGALVALSMLFMADRWRPDQVIYGRYNDAVMGPVLLVGIGAVVNARRSAWLARTFAGVVATTVGTGVLLHLLRADELRAGGGVMSMILGLHAYIGRTGPPIDVLPITTVAVAVIGAVAAVELLGRLGGRSGFALLGLAALIAFGYGRTRDVVDAAENSWTTAQEVQQVRDEGLLPGMPVRFRHVLTDGEPSESVGHQRGRSMLYQFYLPENPMYFDSGRAPSRPTPFVFAPFDDAQLKRSGAEIVWRDPRYPIGLWKEGPRAAMTE